MTSCRNNPLLLLVCTLFLAVGENACAWAQTSSPPEQASAPQESEPIGTTPYDDALRKYNIGKVTPKVFNGDLAAEGAFPWQVSLLVSKIGDPLAGFFCSGAIYSEDWIITAAHCLVRKDPPEDPKGKVFLLKKGQFYIMYGTNVIKAGVSRVGVEGIVVHPNYKAAIFDNDIALVKVQTPFKFDKTTKNIDLVSSEDEPKLAKKDALFTVTGWGSTNAAEEHAGIATHRLRSGAVFFVPPETCAKSISKLYLTENMICTYNQAVDICTGDSGGPIVPYPVSSDAKLLGVVSGNWAGDCGNYDYQRHTRIAMYNEWIKKCTSDPKSCQVSE